MSLLNLLIFAVALTGYLAAALVFWTATHFLAQFSYSAIAGVQRSSFSFMTARDFGFVTKDYQRAVFVFGPTKRLNPLAYWKRMNFMSFCATETPLKRKQRQIGAQ